LEVLLNYNQLKNIIQSFTRVSLQVLGKCILNCIGFMRRFDRKTVALIHDTIAAALTVPLALWLRVGDQITQYPLSLVLKHVLIYSLVASGLFILMQIYRGVWRYVSLNEIMDILFVVTVTCVISAPLMWLISFEESLPRSLMPISWLVTNALLVGSRFSYRLFLDRWDEQKEHGMPIKNLQYILLYGVNDQTDTFLRDQKRNQSSPYIVLGIIDDNLGRKNSFIHNVEVLGSITNLEQIVAGFKKQGRHPHNFVITSPECKGHAVKDLMKQCQAMDVELSRLPDLHNIKGTPAHGFDIKPISLEDLLGRSQVDLNRDDMRDFVAGKRIMITGAGGSIGGELVRQIASYNPAHISLVDHSESLLYQINLELSELYPEISRSLVLADVSDYNRCNAIVEQDTPQVVYHAAAIKHVPLAELNPCEAVVTNVCGTRNMADACWAHQVEAMVCISTDKAVNPTSIMGATKRLSEAYCQALDARGVEESTNTVKHTRYITTRFGNVMGSTGSVIPLFERQLANGGPLTVTHPEIRRFFMTTQEAVELVQQAAVLGYQNPGTSGQIFVLEMGELVKISDLAKEVVSLAGLAPGIDVEIQYVGLRPGEKLIEELFLEDEHLLPTQCKGLMLAKPPLRNYNQVKRGIKDLELAARGQNHEKVRVMLKALVPEFNPSHHKKAA